MASIRLKFVKAYVDRHGKARHYFRKPGCKPVALPGPPGSDEFMAAYGAALAKTPRVEIAARRTRAGSINAMIVSVSLGLPAYRAGQIKMLGVGAPRRMPLASEVPTISESGLPGYQATAWFGLFATADTPDEVVLKINKEVTRIFSDPGFRQRFLDPQMFESMTGPADEFAAFVKAERAKWAKLIAEVGIKIE